MLIYILSFAISLFFIYLSQKFKHNRFMSIMFVTIGLLIPCLIAGLRSNNIGTDVNVYVKPLFENAKKAINFEDYYSSGWSIIWRIKKVSEFELGFSYLVFFITKIFGSLQAVLFFIQFMTIIPLYFGLKKYKIIRDKIWLGILIYYFVFFCFSLNAMRQMIGISIVFYAFSILINEEKKDFVFIMLILFAMLFHKSSALAFIIYFMYKVLMHQEKRNIKLVINNRKISIMKLFIIIVVAFCFIIVFNSKILLSFLNVLGFDTYSNYLINEAVFSFGQLIIRLPIIYLFLSQSKNMLKYDKKYIILIIIFIFDLLISNLSTTSIYASRISVIFNFFNIISLVILTDVSQKNQRNIFNIFLVIIYAIIYWYYIYVSLGSCHVIPYEFF